MFKRIGDLLFFGKKRKSRILLEKEAFERKTKDIFDEISHRLPGFPQGIPVIPVEYLIDKNDDIIKQIILARGLAGLHNKAEVETRIMSPIRHLAEMTHLLPASEKNHFKLPGGLFAFCLEVSLFSIRYAERRILTRATPEIRREEESLWAHAAFLGGLFSEAITAISKLSVYAEDGGIEWYPGVDSLYEWLNRNNLKRYHIRWSPIENISIIQILSGRAIQIDQAEFFTKGERIIYESMLGSLYNRKNLKNPLAKINDTVRYKIMERDEWSYAENYGKPLAGMHLEPWLIDAMRHLVQKKRWNPNEENGRLWYGQDGVFLVWPLAASDMQHELKASECPFIPSTQEILADIMLDAGMIEKSELGGYLFDIGVPTAESEDRKHVEVLKLARYEILFEKTQYKPIKGNLIIEVDREEEEDSFDEELEKNVQIGNRAGKADDKDADAKKAPGSESPSKETKNQDSDSDTEETTESLTEVPKSDKEAIDMNMLFGKQKEPVVERKKVKKKPREVDPVLEEIFSEEPVSLAPNQYDDDYAADYYGNEGAGYQDFSSLTDGIGNQVLDSALEEEKKKPSAIDNSKTKVEKTPEKAKPAPIETQQEKKPNTEKGNQLAQNQSSPEKPIKKPSTEVSSKAESSRTNQNDDLLSELMGTSTCKPKTNPVNPKTKEPDKTDTAGIEGLFGKAQMTSNSDQPGRAALILNKLKKLPAEYLEARAGGITKVLTAGLKNNKLELNDCVSVLKAEGLIVLIDGHETGLDSTGKPKSRYFLVKAELSNGR